MLGRLLRLGRAALLREPPRRLRDPAAVQAQADRERGRDGRERHPPPDAVVRAARAEREHRQNTRGDRYIEQAAQRAAQLLRRDFRGVNGHRHRRRAHGRARDRAAQREAEQRRRAGDDDVADDPEPAHGDQERPASVRIE